MSIANKTYYTSSDLLDSIKKRTNIPDSQNLLNDNDILRLANDEISSSLIPLILSKYEGYFLIQEAVPLIANNNKYEIPYRAIASKLKEVFYLPNINDIENRTEMVQISMEDLGYKSTTINRNRFYIEGENLVLDTDSNSIDPSGGILFFYWIRPNALVLKERVAIIQNIDRTNGIITLINSDENKSSLPENFTASVLYDFIRTKSPHKIISYDIPIININSSAKFIQIDPENIPDKLVIGDRIALSGETDLINCPSELHPLLAQMTATLVLESNGDVQNLAVATRRLEKMEANNGNLIDNRVSGSPFKAKSNHGILRTGGLGRKGRRFTTTSN